MVVIIGTRRLPGILAQFARVFPKVEVDVVVIASREALRRVHANELDMALIVTGNDGQADDGEIVHTEPLVWVGREGGVAIDRSPIPLAVANHGCVWRRSALDALDGQGLNYRALPIPVSTALPRKPQCSLIWPYRRFQKA